MAVPFGRGALAGATAGFVGSVVAYLFVEPVLDRAIALEGGGGAGGPVSRETQKLVGMPVGFVLVGVALGLLFAVAWHVLPSQRAPWQRSMGLALGSFLALGLVPQLRYPANPPGVGDADTITTRTSSYLLALGLGIGVVCGAYAALRALERRGCGASIRQPLVAIGAIVVVAVGYAVLPDSGDAVAAPADLVWDFRLRSLSVLVLLYAGLGATFGLLSERASQPAASARSPLGAGA